MTVAVTRKELGAVELRREAGRCRDARAARRMLALALVLEGSSREDAARAAGMDRQTLRDWVHRYNAEGLDGLRDRRRPGPRPRLTPEQEAELEAVVERGPDPDRDGVVRWRRVDLQELIEARFAVRLHERSVGKVLRRLGFSRVSVRPRHPKADEVAQEAFEKASPIWYARRCPSTPAASRSRSGSWTRPASASRAP
jgi:putative transposase